MMLKSMGFIVVGAAIAGAAIIGYQTYEERAIDTAVEISIGESGVTVDRK